LVANQIGCQCWQAIILAIRRTDLDGDCPALDKAGLRQTLMERGRAGTEIASEITPAASEHPMIGNACCARATTGHAAATPSPAMNDRRFIE
jgi:hypothetical protein